MLALGRFFEDQNLGAEIMGGDGGGETRRPEPDDNDIGLDIPGFRGGAHGSFFLFSVLAAVCPGGRVRYRKGRVRSAPLGLAAGQRDRDVPHRRVGLGAVPVAFAGLDMRDVADIDLALFALVGDHAGAGHDDQQLVAIMRVPAGRAALAEIDDAAIVIRQFPDSRMVWRERDTGPVQPSIRSAPSTGRSGTSFSVTTFMTALSLG